MIEPNKHKYEAVIVTEEKYEKLLLNYNVIKDELDSLKRLVFGAKTERFIPTDPNCIQLSLFDDVQGNTEGEKEEEKQEVSYTRSLAKKTLSKPVRLPIPSHLPRVEVILEPKNIPKGAVKIGEEITETLEMKPSLIFVKKIIRPKYKVKDNPVIQIAELPSLPIPKGNAGSSLLAYILVSKFVDHLPLYRQLKIFKREELRVSSSTISGWCSKMGTLLSPLYECLRTELLENSDYLQADESPIKVQDKSKKKTLHQGYMWVYRNPVKGLVIFEYDKGRARKVPENFLKTFSGTLQTDGYKVYKNLQTKGEITLLGCMAHARRYFEKALENDVSRASYALNLIQKLYLIEREIREDELDQDSVKIERQLSSLPLLNEFEVWLEKNQSLTLPKSLISKAINYTLNIFGNLKRYIDDGRFEIDNNNIENKIRPLAIGRKNYLFAGSHNAAQDYAMFYSFFASCLVNDVNPLEWLTNVIENISEHKANKLKELLPSNWVNLKK
ncbi:MAG: IS66 family transposase [Legionellales bacterium]|nr:IS66 family transposase [Legionellales bacterium]